MKYVEELKAAVAEFNKKNEYKWLKELLKQSCMEEAKKGKTFHESRNEFISETEAKEYYKFISNIAQEIYREDGISYSVTKFPNGAGGWTVSTQFNW